MLLNGRVLKINESLPTDLAQWDGLAEKNGNLVQSTHFDNVQSFFAQKPIYFELWLAGHLAAGVKLYVWRSRKLGALTATLSRAITQFGEVIVDPSDAHEADEITDMLSEAVRDYVSNQLIVTCGVRGYYGGSGLIGKFDSDTLNGEDRFNVAIVGLDRTEDDLWENVGQHHRRQIKKALRSDLVFEEREDLEDFVPLLKKSYEPTPQKLPNTNYIRHLHDNLRKKQQSRIFLVSENERPLASALITRLGNTAYYAFGGTQPNSLGAGNLLHWKIMLQMKNEGVTRYVLGEVAKEADSSNTKFSVGISRFKRGFGSYDAESRSAFYVFRKGHHQLWKTLKRLTRVDKRKLR
jgi:hypothetical protein